MKKTNKQKPVAKKPAKAKRKPNLKEEVRRMTP